MSVCEHSGIEFKSLNGWKHVSNESPPIDQLVLISDGSCIELATLHEDQGTSFWNAEVIRERIILWHHIPELPE